MIVAERPLIVIGVGNVLLRDDAVGVRVVEALRTLVDGEAGALPAGTQLVDGGTLGLDLLRTIAGSRGLVLVDAVRLGGPAGTVSVLRGDAIVASGGPRGGAAPDSIGQLFAVARLMGWLPGEVALVGIEAARIELGLRLSGEVERALPVALDAVRGELRRMDAAGATGMQAEGTTARMAGATA